MVSFGGPTPGREQAGEYEIWDIRGVTAANLSPGETLENVLVDDRGPGNALRIDATGSGWAIRNVGWMGVPDRHPPRFNIECAGHGTIENIYMEGWGTRSGGGFTKGSHGGHIDVRHSYIAGFGNNAFYCSGVSKDNNAGGTATFEDCYHRDNTVTQYRIGAPGSVVRNCVGIVNDPSGNRGLYLDGSSKGARGAWARHCPDLHFENCSMYVSPNDVEPVHPFSIVHLGSRSNCSRAEAVITDCHVNSDAPQPHVELGVGSTESTINNLGHSPTADVLVEGVPTSAEMAARGERTIPDIPEIPGGGGGGNGGGDPPDDGNGNGNGNGNGDEPQPPTDPRMNPIGLALIGAAAAYVSIYDDE